MSNKFNPTYSITPEIVQSLMKIEAARQQSLHLPYKPAVLASLRESARLYTTHYSTMIEGNRLNPSQIEQILKHDGHFPGRKRDEDEVRGYYAALSCVEQWALQELALTEIMIKKIHALVMAGGKTNVKPTPYRTGQNVIRDGVSHAIVYLPPEAGDVPKLMKKLVAWLQQNSQLPIPLLASIAHYQFATIHPYYDGNGRTARLLTTFILYAGGYDLKGLYSLEEYYARNLPAYYAAISIGPSHNYYLGRAEADITTWITYFLEGMTLAFEKVIQHLHAIEFELTTDQSRMIQKLDPKQRKVFSLFQYHDTITAQQVGSLFGFKARTSSHLCKKWVDEGFLSITDPSRKNRKYTLCPRYKKLIKK